MSDPVDRAAERARETLRTLESIDQIPTLPAVLVQVWDLTRRESTSAADLGRALSADPGLVGSVLRLANSAYFGFPRKVSTVTQAIVVLGFETVKSLALGASVFGVLARKSGWLDTDRFFRHGLATGMGARLLVERHAPQNGGAAFCGGVLHDLGKLVLAEFLPDCWRRLETGLRQGMPYEEAERAAAGLTHGEIGLWFAERWNFPAELATAVRWHHRPDEAPDGAEYAAAVHLADIVAHRCDVSGDARPVLPEPAPGALARYGLTEETLEALTREVRELMADAGTSATILGA